MPITVKRLSDNATHTFEDVSPSNWVKGLKDRLRKDFIPKFPNGCRLIYNGKVLKSRHHLKHYKIKDNDVVDMDDRKNWSSSSSSSDSTD